MKRFLLCSLCFLLFTAFAAASTPTITPVASSRAGSVVATAGQAANASKTDVWVGTGKELLIVNNAAGSPITVTLNFGPGATIDGQTPTSRTVSVAAGATTIIGPFPPNLYNDATGNVSVTYSAVTSVTVLVVYVGN